MRVSLAVCFYLGAGGGLQPDRAAKAGCSPAVGDGQCRPAEALIVAKPGDTIELAAGTYHFKSSLSLDVDPSRCSGAGMDKTILSFKDQNAGSEGLLVTSDGVTARASPSKTPRETGSRPKARTASPART